MIQGPRFNIKEITIAQLPDFNCKMQEQQTIVTAMKIGLFIEFETPEQCEEFLNDLCRILSSADKNTAPIADAMKSLFKPQTTCISVHNLNDAMTTEIDKVKPALEFLDLYFPGNDFLNRVIANEATKSQRLLTPGRDAEEFIDIPLTSMIPDAPEVPPAPEVRVTSNTIWSRCLIS